MNAWQEERESAAATSDFLLGTWLYYYTHGVYKRGTHTLQDQIDCLYRLFRAGIHHPRYRFFTVFDFGEREFDTIMEQGNSDQVIQGLREIYQKEKVFGIAEAFAYHGWSLADERQLAMF